MSAVRYFKPANTLAKAIAAPGGKRISEAVVDADANLASVAEACLERVDAALVHIHRLCAAVPTGAEVAELYHEAREVAGLAAIAGLKELGEAALSFCGLLDRAQEGGRLTAAHLRIYGDVFRTLRHAHLFKAEERAEVLSKLDVMAGRIAPPAAPAAS